MKKIWSLLIIIIVCSLLTGCARTVFDHFYTQKQLKNNFINVQEIVRVDEYLNAFPQDWLKLPKDEELVVRVDPLTNVKAANEHHSIHQIAIKTRNPIQKEIAEPIGLSLVIDVSGSMLFKKMEDTKEALINTIQELKFNDVISLITFNHDSQVIASKVVVNEETRVHLINEVNDLSPEGGTNIAAGLVEGYRELAKFPSGIKKRLILLTDGISKVETISPKDIAEKAGVDYLDEVTITTIGLGYAVDQKLLRKIADSGNGHYYFAENSEVLTKCLHDDLQTTVIPVVKDISLNIELGKGYVLESIYGCASDNFIGKQSFKIFLKELNVRDCRIIILELKKISEGEVQALDVSGTFFSIIGNSKKDIKDLKTGLIVNKAKLKNINEYVLRNAIVFGNAVSLIEVSKLYKEYKYDEALRVIETQINNNDILLKLEQTERLNKERDNLIRSKSIIASKAGNSITKESKTEDDSKSLDANRAMRKLILSGSKLSLKTLPGLWRTIAQLLIAATE